MNENTPTPSGAIHDIGYRHYDGPVLGRMHLIQALYLDTLRGSVGLGRPVGAKVLAALLGTVMVLPALVTGISVNMSGDLQLPLQYTSYASGLQLIISIYLAVQAPVAVSRDLRFRTITLYFSRPLRRSDYVLARYAALATAVFGLIAAPLAVLYASALLAKMSWGVQTRGFVLALLGAVLFAVVLSGLALLIAAITSRRGFGVAAIIATLLLLSVIASTAQFVALKLLDADPFLPEAPLSTFGGAMFGVGTVAVVAVCTGLLLLRYRKVSPA
ncbi:MAG: hypothetical protein P8Z68_05795 [Kineosporiaceae bacterium]